MSRFLGLHGRMVSIAAASLALGACYFETQSPEPVGSSTQAMTVCATSSVVKGVDVSVYQGSINWTAVKAAGIDFAIARISDGTDLDTEFATNWKGMKSAGLVRGAYQFFEPGDDPTTQANVVISSVGVLGAGDLPVTADMEVTGGQSAASIAAKLKTWISAVKEGTGKVPMIYTAEGYWDNDVASTDFSADPLWAANWGASCPDLSTGWSTWSIWQYSDSGTVGGISNAVDLDEFNGALADLQAFAGGGATSSTDAGAGSTGYYGAQYVRQSWPLATTSLAMTSCQTLPASITFKNTGTKTWDTNTRLATTNPRDRKSVFADSTWIADDRPAQVTGTVPPGGEFEFKFDLHAPDAAGNYEEYFGLVEDGVAWFGDPGQGGPSDTDIEASITVTIDGATCEVDMGVPDGGSPTKADAGKSAVDGGVSSVEAGPSERDATSASRRPDAGTPDLGDTPMSSGNGCACAVASRRSSSDSSGWTVAFLALGAMRRRRAHSRSSRRV